MNNKNILIRTDFVVYNTKGIYDDEIVKIPSYVINDILEHNKRILIKFKEANVALYTTEELKRNMLTVEGRVYNGRFRNQDIEYNLVHVRINFFNDKEKRILITKENQIGRNNKNRTVYPTM